MPDQTNSQNNLTDILFIQVKVLHVRVSYEATNWFEEFEIVTSFYPCIMT